MYVNACFLELDSFLRAVDFLLLLIEKTDQLKNTFEYKNSYLKGVCIKSLIWFGKKNVCTCFCQVELIKAQLRNIS